MPDVLKIGSSFSHYRIELKLGEGGMGEVYLAEDTRLFRKVALKILPEEVARRADRLARFEQEARAASALNHPNILTIYEVGEAEGLHFLATEYIDGRTLREVVHSKSLSLDSILDVAIQTASALSAAHEAGISHRDIKPENIMIRRDKLVKVLDFGLAKLVGEGPPDIDTEAKTRAQVKTEPGVILGTVNYMSPEQARGKETDSRSDTWSLGCVIYEMVAGVSPFQGETTADRIAAIIHKDPAPLASVVEGIPARLDEIVSKCLEKDRDERYQVVKDLLIDLRRLKKKLDIDVEIERSRPPNDIDRTDAPSENRTQMISAAYSDTGGVMSTVSSAEYVVSGIKKHKAGVGLGLLFLLAATSIGGFLLYRSRATVAKPRGEMKMTRLVTGLDGLPGNVSISPDGRFVAYGLLKDGKQGLWIRQVAQQNAVEIVKPVEGANFLGIQFSPDSSLVYFVRGNADNDPKNSLYEMPVLGGREPRRIMSDIGSPPSLSPDAKQVAFVRNHQATGESFVMTANIDGAGEPRRVATRSGDYWFDRVSWSPDGKRIACATAKTAGGASYGVVEIPAGGGDEIPFARSEFAYPIQRMTWLADGTGLILLSNIGGLAQIWSLSYPEGVATRITNDLNAYGGVMPTADGTTIAASLGEYTSRLWSVAPGEPESKAKRLTLGREDGQAGLTIMSNGRVIYTARTNEGVALMAAGADGGEPKQLASDPDSLQSPAASPDGRYVVFVSFQPDNVPHLWRVDAEGGNLKQLTTTEDYNPSITPDSRTIVFNSFRTGKRSLWRVSIDGGEAVQVNDYGSGPRVSPDGKVVLYSRETTDGKPGWAMDSLDDGKLIRYLDLPGRAYQPMWSPDGKSIVYVLETGDVGNIWIQPLAGGAPKQITKYTSEWLDRFAISPDGKTIIAARTHGKNDIVLIKDFR